MSRALANSLGKLERALGLSHGADLPDAGAWPDGEHADREWVPPEEAQRTQLPLLRLFAAHAPRPWWFAGRRAAVERSHPSQGYWRKRDPDGELRVGELCDGLLSRMRASSIILQQLAADPARCARIDAEGIARLRSYLRADDVLQPLLERMQAAAPAVEDVDDLAMLRPSAEVAFAPPGYGVDPDEDAATSSPEGHA